MKSHLSLREKTITGAKITTSVTAYNSLIDFGANLVLIRLLAPDIFGAMTYALIMVSLVGMFLTLSSKSAIIQRKDDKIEKHIDVAFTVELMLSICAMGILFIASPFVMTMLEHPELSLFTQMIALTLPINQLALPGVIFMRNLDFRKANIAPVISITVKAVITVACALSGLGIWSFFWGILGGSIVSAIVVWQIIPYRPKIDFDGKTIRELSKFGLPLTGTAILAYCYWNVDDLMVGSLLGAEQLGYYWLAFKIPHYILNAQNSVTSVVFPALARAENDDQLRRGFELATKFSAIVLLLPCAIVLVFGEATIRIVFGERWLPALIPFQIFMVLITVRGIAAYWTQVLTVKERTGALLKITMQNALVLSILGYFFTKKFGITGAAIAVFVTIIISLPYMSWQLKKCIEISYLKILWQGITSFFFVLIAGLLLKKTIPNPGFSLFLLEVAAMILLYVGVIIILDNRFIQFLKEIFKSNKKYSGASS